MRATSNRHSKLDPIVRRMDQILLGPQVPFGSLNRGVPREQLDLFEFAARCATHFRVATTKVMRRNSERFAEMHDRFVELALPRQRGAQVVVGVGVRGIALDGFLVVGDGLVETISRGHSDGQIIVRRRVIRADCECGLEVSDGVGQVPLFRQRRAQVVVGFG